MKKNIIFFSALLLAGMSFIYSGCTKEKDEDNKNDQRAAIDNSTAENTFNDIFKLVDKAAKLSTSSGAKTAQLDSIGSCATITISPFDTTWPKTLTIDFGSSNCICEDLKYRRGKIIANLTGKYQDSATVTTVTLDNYYVNDNHVEGTKTITNMGHVGTYNGGKNLKYSIVVKNGKITTSNGFITWESARFREWITGESTAWPNWQDDSYLLTGNSSGTDLDGNSYTVNIINGLLVALDCKWIKSGTIEITPEELTTRTIDFGTGDCDNQARIIVNGISYTFTMN